ncbi:MAG: hypothetical protein HKN16_02790 [Saprospiraceae bacterium]|nr:hypothetical protein [Saprospiraceae bacterium]
MKHLSLSLAIMLVAGTLVSQDTDKSIFSIHLGSFVEIHADDFADARSLGFMYSESYSDHLTEVFLGEFKNKTEAERILQQAQLLGFNDAYINERTLKAGEDATVIQLGVEIASEKIHWGQYTAAQPLSVVLLGEQVRVVTGPFPSEEATIKQLEKLQKKGFANAFMRSVHSLRLHPISEFEAPGLFNPEPEPLVVENPTPAPVISIPEPDFSEALTEEAVAVELSPPPVQAIPENYVPEFTARSGANTQLALPEIRMDIKRTSALKLQSALKLDEYYGGSLDGIYGQLTSGALQEYFNNDAQWKKIQILKDYLPTERISLKDALENAIDMILTDPSMAEQKLEGFDHPLAKGYLAYLFHTNKNDLEKVNDLMNAANKVAYQKNNPPIDISVDYNYKKLEQLLGHLALMHASHLEVAAPCWLFQRHPDEARSAFQKVSDYRVEPCDPFMDWEMLATLKLVAMELDPAPQKGKATEIDLASIRSKLFINPKPLTTREQKHMLKWYEELWAGFDAWLTKDPLHQKLASPLKISFFQSQVLLEDYYLDKGFSYAEAKPLAITVLKTIVNDHLKTYKS